jgi:DNA-binding XRE family transcriptional regulator
MCFVIVFIFKHTHFYAQITCISQNLNYFCIKIWSNMKLNRIKIVLDQKGISQTWLAKQVGKSFSTINSYACNRYQPDLETLLAISKILQVDLKDLITAEGERQ